MTLTLSRPDPLARIISVTPPARDNEYIDEREMMRRWVETWKEVGPVLEEIRRCG